MRFIIRPALLGIVGVTCLVAANVVSRREGDITTPAVYRFLLLLSWVGFLAGVAGLIWSYLVRRRSSCIFDIAFCAAVILFAAFTFVRLPSYIRTAGLTTPHSYSDRPNKALQRTAAGRRSCNRRVSWPPSLSFGR